HYRDLWTTPVRVEVLDLARVGGGLTPTKRGGGRQTKSLRFQSADGRTYVFRSVDKDPAGAMPPELRGTFVQDIVQDQISSSHPAGALVVAPLLAAARVWRPIPRDRDQAFSRLDGFLPWLARYYHPDVVSFGRTYPDMVGLNWDARALDRRLLTDLERPVWDSTAAALQVQLTDSVIDV